MAEAGCPPRLWRRLGRADGNDRARGARCRRRGHRHHPGLPAEPRAAVRRPDRARSSPKTCMQRKMLMFERADAFVALAGGVGTLEELVEQMTWAQLGRHQKPVLLANIARLLGSADPPSRRHAAGEVHPRRPGSLGARSQSGRRISCRCCSAPSAGGRSRNWRRRSRPSRSAGCELLGGRAHRCRRTPSASL